jgi:transposase InsO family protein
MVKVMLGMAMFPVVWRSDNAKEFVSEVVAEMNKMLEIRHVTGSAYHPQSQGMVESMHKTINHLVRGLVDDHPDD